MSERSHRFGGIKPLFVNLKLSFALEHNTGAMGLKRDVCIAYLSYLLRTCETFKF